MDYEFDDCMNFLFKGLMVNNNSFVNNKTLKKLRLCNFCEYNEITIVGWRHLFKCMEQIKYLQVYQMLFYLLLLNGSAGESTVMAYR